MSTPSVPAVQITGLRKSFRVAGATIEAVSGIDLTVPAGEIFGLLGPNGAGKTTTLRILTTLLPADAGTAFVAGADVLRTPALVRRRIGYVGQLGGADKEGTGRENLMLAGRLKLASKGEKDESTLCFALDLGDRELRFLDDKRMGKAYLIRRGDEGRVPGLATLGVDVLSPAFTKEHFSTLAAKRRDQVRAFLMDKTAISAIGNAYADEILFAAHLHPKTFCRKIDPAGVDALYGAIGRVLDELGRGRKSRPS